MRLVFQVAAVTSVVISALILFVLFRGALQFLNSIDFDFGKLSDTGWFPRRERFDLRTIAVGSIVVGSVAMLVAVPFGIGTAIYLAEYARATRPPVVKPIIEVLAGMPSVVIGLFAIKFIAPDVVGELFDPTQSSEHARRRARIGILVIPIMASVSEDALSAVPGSFARPAMGAERRRSRPSPRWCCRRRCQDSWRRSSLPSAGRSARRWSPRWREGRPTRCRGKGPIHSSPA